MALPSPGRTDGRPEDGASRPHVGQACRNKATGQLARMLAGAVGAAAPPEDAHCGTFLKSLTLKTSHCIRTEMNLQISQLKIYDLQSPSPRVRVVGISRRCWAIQTLSV